MIRDLIDLICSLFLRQYTMMPGQMVAMMKMINPYKDKNFKLK